MSIPPLIFEDTFGKHSKQVGAGVEDGKSK